MSEEWLAIGIGICLWIFAIGLRIKWEGQIDHKTYYGKVLFETTEEYAKFKRAIANEQVYSWKADILSSAPPVVVEFRVTVTPEHNFPFGDEHICTRVAASSLPEALGAFGTTSLILGIVFILCM